MLLRKRSSENAFKNTQRIFDHVKDLSNKDYSAYEMSLPIFMWLDNVTAAVEEMPDIVEKSAELKVISPPSLVFACLKTTIYAQQLEC